MGKLAGKVALITGAASGIGAGQAKLFIEEGARVVLCDVNPAGEALARSLGANALFVSLDVGSPEEWLRAIATAEERFGPINVLVNTAGAYLAASFADTTLEQFMRLFHVNQLGVFLGMKAVLPSMIRNGGGAIINVSSAAGIRGAPGLSAYSGTKWAVRGLTKSVAKELAGHNVRVNAILPGPIDTPLLRTNTDELIAAMIAGNPSKRLGTANDIARATVFLASDDSAYVTGDDLIVDGGATI